MLGRDADAGVGDGEGDEVLVVDARPHPHLAARRELERVGDEVAQDLRDPLVVGVEADHRLGLLEDEPHLLVLQDRPEHAAQRREQVEHVEPGRRDGDAPGLDAREVEQVVDHVHELEGGGLDELELLALLGQQRPVELVEQDAPDAADRAERRAELVAQVGEEPALELGGLAELPVLLVELGVERDDALVRLGQLDLERGDLGLALGQEPLERGELGVAHAALLRATSTVASSCARRWSRCRAAATIAGWRAWRPG